jgi:hypothetical protein
MSRLMWGGLTPDSGLRTVGEGGMYRWVWIRPGRWAGVVIMGIVCVEVVGVCCEMGMGKGGVGV